ncbi:MAG: alpha/beta hydrolase [Rhodospirillales bacterium]|nr:alpha/beta hydrolase [Rhodospirillales bacterium]
MATFVLVHGGGHGGWCYQRLARRLRAHGHEVHCPTLTGLGERRHLLGPGINLDTHIEDVVSLLVHEDLHDVFLAGHSYGGMVITGVADRAQGRVGHLIFLDAAHPRGGEALTTIAAAQMGMASAFLSQVNGVECYHLPDAIAETAYGVSDPDDVLWMKPRLAPHPWACMTQPLHLADEAAVMAIPRTSVNCTPTLAVRPKEYLHRTLEADHLFEIDTGHDLMITEPDKVAQMLLSLV